QTRATREWSSDVCSSDLVSHVAGSRAIPAQFAVNEMVEVHLRIHPTVENVTAQSQSVELVHTSVREQGEIQFRRAVLSAEHHGEAVFRCQTLVPRTQPTNGDTGILLGTGPPIRKEQFETGGPFAVQQRVGIDARGGTPKVLGRHHDADGRNVKKRVSQS